GSVSRDAKGLRDRHRPVTRAGDTPPVGRAIERLDAMLDPMTQSPPRNASPQRRGRVLVVEDEPDVAELIRYNLVKEGWEVLTASSGAEALKRVREAHPDVVLLDIMVPHLNGWEVCRRLKEDPETRAIPVIMVTGRVEEGDKVLGFELGADELLDFVGGGDGFVEPRTVDVHLARLRRKFILAKLPAPRIDTVRGVGYRFREPA